MWGTEGSNGNGRRQGKKMRWGNGERREEVRVGGHEEVVRGGSGWGGGTERHSKPRFGKGVLPEKGEDNGEERHGLARRRGWGGQTGNTNCLSLQVIGGGRAFSTGRKPFTRLNGDSKGRSQPLRNSSLTSRRKRGN